MAQETHTGEGRALSAALSAPAPFTSRATAMALHATERHVERWAPETGAEKHSRGLGALSFVDRLLTPWMTAAASPMRAGGNSRDVSPVSWVFPRPWYQDELDWMASQREAGEQTGALLTTRGTYAAPARTSSSIYQMPPAPPAQMPSVQLPTMQPPAMMAAERMGGPEGPLVVVTADQAPRSLRTPGLAAGLEFVAPSLSRSLSSQTSQTNESMARAMSPAATATQRTLRAWTPQVSFAAAQAAEVMAGAVAIAEGAGLMTAGRSPVLEGLAYVAPRQVAAADEDRPATTTSSIAATPARAPMADTTTAQLTRTIAQLAAVQEASRAQSAAAAREAVASTASIRAPEPRPMAAQPVGAPAPAPSAPVLDQAFRAEQVRVIEEIRQSREAAAAAVTASAPAPATPPMADLAILAASSPAAAQAMRTVELVARSAIAGTFAPSSGPRVSLPAGLGGALVGLEAATTTSHPMLSSPESAAVATAAARAPRAMLSMPTLAAVPFVSASGAPAAFAATPAPMSSAIAQMLGRMPMIAPTAAPTATPSVAPAPRAFSPVWAAPAPQPALSAIAAERPVAMAQLAWADRWLARVAGASPTSLAALDVAREHAIAVPRALSIGAPEMAFVVPSLISSPVAPPTAETFTAPTARAAAPIARSAELRTPDPELRAPSVRAIPAPEVLRAPEPARPEVSAPRVDEAEPVPDEVFAAIARSARPRTTRAATPLTPSAPPADLPTAAPELAATFAAEPTRRPTLADQIARSAPSAPTAGLHPGLASSPMAPALAAVLPLPAAPTFDPRAMFGAGIAAAYVGGALTRALASPSLWAELSSPGAVATRELAWLPAALAGLPFVSPLGISHLADRAAAPSETAEGGAIEPTLSVAGRAPVPSWLVPSAPPAPTAAAEPETHDVVVQRQVAAAPAPAELAWSVHSSMLAPLALASIDPVAAASSAGLSSRAFATQVDHPTPGFDASIDDAAPLPMAPGFSATDAIAPYEAPAQPYAMPMAMPFTAIDAAGWTARPGMTAEMAQGFAVEHERTAADLAFDFVPPELVLAARVYGFGAIEAAQAARLAVAGPAGLSAMASSLDLTFLRQLHVAAEQRAIESDPARVAMRRELGAPAMTMPSLTTPRPVGEPDAPISYTAEEIAARPELAAAIAAGIPASGATPTAAAASAIAPEMLPFVWPSAAAPSAGGTVFGVPRHLPRGVFHWPAGAVAALDLRAELPFGAATSTVAALELLAAGAVADMAQLVSPSALLASESGEGDDAAFAPGVTGRAADALAAMRAFTSGAPSEAAAAAGTEPGIPGFSFVAPSATSASSAPAADIGEAVAVAESFGVPTAERDRFASIYVTLARSPAGQSLSPSVRAARALAIATGHDSGVSSAQERARAAWSVMPVVFGGEDPAVAASLSTYAEGFGGGESAAVAGRAPELSVVRGGGASMSPTTMMSPSIAAAGSALSSVIAPTSSAAGTPPGTAAEQRPGLSGLSARAGEALGSFVSPSSPEVESASSGAARARGPAERAGAAEPLVQELVRTGRSFSKTGGGETTIPSWFEAAARKMLEGRGGLGENISIAELTLIATAPSRAVAADAKDGGTPAPSMAAPAPGAAGAAQGNAPNVEQLASDVYELLMKTFEFARQRSGDPWV